ncbi:zinc finger protein [Aphelenchoides avenae]|nr:zinc finger protein [Aphelenchus avenae]
MCRLCKKYLSSKRSYEEHMNIHNRRRPFACDECEYAAASQMTLRRHKLRNHTPRQEWGYRCPHCTEAYMEPASYQQHVLTRHFGKSATFGCPYSGCQFTTKSSKHFRDHFSKHSVVSSTGESYSMRGVSRDDDFARYLVDDEIGSGYGREADRPVIHRVRNVVEICDIRGVGMTSRQPIRLQERIVPAEHFERFEHPARRLPIKLATDADVLSAQISDIDLADECRLDVPLLEGVNWLGSEVEIDDGAESNALPGGLAEIDLD